VSDGSFAKHVVSISPKVFSAFLFDFIETMKVFQTAFREIAAVEDTGLQITNPKR
jgi:hypothetical protein